MSVEKTYIMLKPDAIERRLMGEIITKIEQKGYQISQAKLMTLDKAIVAAHYAHLTEKDFYPRLEQFMMSGPVFGMVVEGEAAPGTIRGDFATDITYNLIHGSDSPEAAHDEIQRFFGA